MRGNSSQFALWFASSLSFFLASAFLAFAFAFLSRFFCLFSAYFAFLFATFARFFSLSNFFSSWAMRFYNLACFAMVKYFLFNNNKISLASSIPLPIYVRNLNKRNRLDQISNHKSDLGARYTLFVYLWRANSHFPAFFLTQDARLILNL